MLTIGEFSRLTHISARMLRHYDMRGVLRPAHVGENGYRYYDEAQLGHAARIETLKGYGFTLAEIAGLLRLPEDELAQQMHARRLAAFRELHELQKSVRLLEEQLIDMEASGMTDKYKVIEMNCPAQTVFSLRKTIHIGQVGELFQQLNAEVAKRGLTRTGATQQLYHNEEFSYESMDVEAQMEVAPGQDTHEEPAGLFISTIHKGPYETIRHAYDALAAHMAQNPQYRVAGPAVERYLKDHSMVNSEEELETAVLFRVEKAGDL